jgi:hypothetical protein
MPEFDREAIEKRYRARRAMLEFFLLDKDTGDHITQELNADIIACLAEIDRLNVKIVQQERVIAAADNMMTTSRSWPLARALDAYYKEAEADEEQEPKP